MMMQNFESKTLKKTFDKIVFGRCRRSAPRHAAVAARPVPARSPRRRGQGAKVTKATGANAKTVAEVVAGKATLKGKPVLVRGQVVKVNYRHHG